MSYPHEKATGMIREALNDNQGAEAFTRYIIKPPRRKTGPRDRLAVCNRMVRSTIDRGMTAFAGIKEKHGKWCICDGFRFFRFTADIPSLPRARTAIDYEAFWDTINPGDALPPVDRAEVKAFAAEHKMRRTAKNTQAVPVAPYTPAGWPHWYKVNPLYLLDILDAVPKATFYAPSRRTEAVYFKDADGNDGALCPIVPHN